MAAVIERTESSFPLSPEQRALLAMWDGEASATEAAQLLLVEIDGNIEPARLCAALASELRRHEVLRASIRPVAGYRGLRLQPGDDAPSPGWQQLDLRNEQDPDAALARWLQDFRRTPLAIGQGKLVRAALVRTGEVRSTLALAVSALVADRGSLASLAEGIARAYRGEHVGDDGDVLQYAQYVEWRQDLEAGEDAPAGRDYWRSYLPDAGTLTPPRLAYRNAGAPVPTPPRLRAARAVDAALAGRIDGLAASVGSGAEVVLQAAWWLLLARLTDFNRFAAGWQHDCRRDYEVMQGAVGVFEKVLPLVVAGTGEETFAQWLARLDGVAGAHLDAQEYWAVDAPAITAHLAVGFTFHNAAGRRCAGTAWRVSELPAPMPCFELALQADWSEDGGELAICADPALYSQQAIERLLDQYATLLQGVLERPATVVAELPGVGAAERELLLMHGPSADYGTRTIAERIAHWAASTPDAPAVEAGDRRLSYGELEARANRMAHWLQAQGVRPGALVALELPRSPELLVAMLAAWRAGAGYLPLEPEWPAGRRQAVLADAGPALVLRAAPVESAETASWYEAAIGDVELERFPATAPAHAAAADDLAYVLYTSGSTGRPKGVVIGQRQLLNYVAAASAAMALDPCRRWALTSSVVADLGNTALFCAWFNGACVVVADRDDVADAGSFARFMAERRIDALKMVPSHLEALLECDTPQLPCTLVLGGEAAPRALVERIARRAPECTLYNHYGPTEATVGVMIHQVETGHAVPEVLPLSQVLANNRVYVLDPAMRAVPAGGMGEVYIGGAQLCDGYLNRAADGVMVVDPFRPGERLYRTGDLAHVLPEGGIRLAGRADHQVKIRGFRVEPAEVEAALLAQPGVSQAVVLALADQGGEPELTAFLVAAEELVGDGGRQRLCERLAAVLPAHMLPAHYTFVAAFPRLPNGKIDRIALSALAGGRPDHANSSEATSDPLAAEIADCMATLLKRPAIGAHDDFFDLGGHSLLAIKLAARLRKLFQVELAPGVVFDYRSAAALAAFLRHNRPAVQALDASAARALAGDGAWGGEGGQGQPLVPNLDGILVARGAEGCQGVPLFCFPGLFASALEYCQIVDRLQTDRPVHSFVCHTLTRARWHRWSLEGLAAGYARYIADTAGAGPVALLGWSVGGDLAFEVARQLADAGHEVRFVGLLDVMRPIATELRARAGDGAPADVDGRVRDWIDGSSMRERWLELFDRLDEEEKALAAGFLRDELLASAPDGPDMDSAEYRAWARINHGAMMRRYAWRRCGVPAYVWRAGESVVGAGGQLRDWSLLADARHERIVGDCNHRSLLEHPDLLRDLAERLQAID